MTAWDPQHERDRMMVRDWVGLGVIVLLAIWMVVALVEKGWRIFYE